MEGTLVVSAAAQLHRTGIDATEDGSSAEPLCQPKLTKKIYKWLWDSSESACSSSPSLCASQDKASEFDSLSLSLNERPVLGIKRVFNSLLG
jgi:hypothetical protein